MSTQVYSRTRNQQQQQQQSDMSSTENRFKRRNNYRGGRGRGGGGRGGGGRGRGRSNFKGRRNNMRRSQFKKPEEKKKLQPVTVGPYLMRIGTKYTYTPPQEALKEEYLSVIPRQRTMRNPSDEVEEIGWMYNGNQDVYEHPLYKGYEFEYTEFEYNGERHYLPVAHENFNDTKGLCFVRELKNEHVNWRQNKWVEYAETSEGIKDLQNAFYRHQRKSNKLKYEALKLEKKDEAMAMYHAATANPPLQL